MSRERASDLRITILELLLSLPAPEALAAYITTYYTNETLHKNMKKLIEYNSKLTALNPSDPKSDQASQDIIRNIETLYNEIVKEMAEETKADIKTKG
jgi:CRISPR/Cas system CMR subunit Cmr4 (Cas7 group RAMP superfamily)